MTKSNSRPKPVPADTLQASAPLPIGRNGRRTIHDPRIPRSAEEARAGYVAARTAWTEAMHQAASGRPADLATLAIAQEAYEHAAIEWARWESGPRVAIPVEERPRDRGIQAVIGQELEWRRVREVHHPRGLKGLLRRLTGRR